MKAFVIFEDDLHQNFYPLSLTRPVWDLRTGIASFKERWTRFIRSRYGEDARIAWFTRGALETVSKSIHPRSEINNYNIFEQCDDIVFLNGASFLKGDELSLEENRMLLFQNQPLAARIASKRLNRGMESIPAMIMESGVKATAFEEPDDCGEIGRAFWIWDLVAQNPAMLAKDYKEQYARRDRGVPGGVTIIGDSTQIYMGSGVAIEPHVVLNTEGGPIVIEDETKITAFTRIEGPAYIGKRCMLLSAKVRKGCSIGDSCRIGGEVEESIFQGFSNKYHDGFIGHSYIGEWVNMGALTTNSDLKNNYKDVKVYIPEVRKNSKLNKVGCFMGDHVKTSIGTLINTGTSIGPGAMLVHSGAMTPGHVPPFAWFMNGKIEHVPWLDDFLSAASTMMSRRGVAMTSMYAAMLRELYRRFQQGN